jgi:hypothetical protein
VILARDTSKLEQAKDDILKSRQSDNQHVESYSVDLGDALAVRFFPLFAIMTFFTNLTVLLFLCYAQQFCF